MSYSTENKVKANFTNIYTSPTPHAYIAGMAELGYEIGEQARPYLAAAARKLIEENGEAWPVQMLDIGCSYGLGSAFVRYGCTFDEIVAFFGSRAPQEYELCCEAFRQWLNVVPPVCNIRCVGLDSSEPAIKFAVNAGVLDGGVAANYEEAERPPTEEEVAWFRGVNLLVSTGAIGYVTDKTLDRVLPHVGEGHPADRGPWSVNTILRMFDSNPIEASFTRHGYRFGKVEGIYLPQRRFRDEEEQQKVIDILETKGLDPSHHESTGKYFAELFIAAPPDQYDMLEECMTQTHAEWTARCDQAFIAR